MKKRLRLRAVALIVANPVGEILVLQEFVTKAHIGKFAGMWSIPMETVDPGQDSMATLSQLHLEELAGLPSIQMPARYIGAYEVVPDVWARLYATTSSTYELPAIYGNEHEVRNHQWLPIHVALELWLRQGAEEMIRDYAGGLENVVRRNCNEVRKVSNKVRT
ncbi:MAG: NUDIX hydrolase [bacterium]|nr:NUDIX hydrolase [bacterium]